MQDNIMTKTYLKNLVVGRISVHQVFFIWGVCFLILGPLLLMLPLNFEWFRSQLITVPLGYFGKFYYYYYPLGYMAISLVSFIRQKSFIGFIYFLLTLLHFTYIHFPLGIFIAPLSDGLVNYSYK